MKIVVERCTKYCSIPTSYKDDFPSDHSHLSTKTNVFVPAALLASVKSNEVISRKIQWSQIQRHNVPTCCLSPCRSIPQHAETRIVIWKKGINQEAVLHRGLSKNKPWKRRQ